MIEIDTPDTLTDDLAVYLLNDGPLYRSTTHDDT